MTKTVHHLVAADLRVGAPVIESPKPKRPHKPTLKSALTQAQKAGVTPTSATIAPDGSVKLEFGKREDVESNANGKAEEKNEWDNIQ
jgi:hypothetical protein